MSMSRSSNNTFRSFAVISSFDFERLAEETVRKEIEGKDKSFILGVDRETFKKQIVDRYTLHEVSIDFTNQHTNTPHVVKRRVPGRFREETYETEVYSIKVDFPFTGSEDVFRIKPATWTMVSEEITVSGNVVSFIIELQDRDAEKFRNAVDARRQSAFTNLANANAFIRQLSPKIPGWFDRYFDAQHKKFSSENNFFEAIGVKVNPRTEVVFHPQTVQRKVIPEIKVDPKRSEPLPTLQLNIYQDILQILYASGKGMERKPSTYSGKSEPEIRDLFLWLLETRYESATATGETFNKEGKTDILIKYAKDGSNLFVAECKKWTGSKGLSDGISQLFDRYLTWRDSKAALMVFVSVRDFTAVLASIKDAVKQHPNHVRFVGERGESSFSYVFNLPDDTQKEILLEVMAFWLPEA